MQKLLKPLIRQAQTGDLEAYGTLVKRFQDMAVGYAYSILRDFHMAEDAAQEAFIEAHSCLGGLREPDAFPRWLQRIVFKHCDRLKRKMRIRTVPLEEALETPSDGMEPLAQITDREQKGDVLAAVATLSEQDQAVITLFYISEYSHRQIAEFLGIPVTTVNHRLRAARGRLKERMMKMVRGNVRENRPSRNDRFANQALLFSAIESDSGGKVKVLLSKEPTLINATNHTTRETEWAAVVTDMTPLHYAAGCGCKGIVQFLVDRGADVNAGSGDGRTPLHCVACGTATQDIAEILLDRGADINAKDNRGETPMCLAIRCDLPWNEPCADHIGLAGFLADRGAEMEIFSATGGYRSRRFNIAPLLQADPALAKARNAEGDTPLHWAARMHDASQKAALLLAHGADPNARDNQGRTPLYVGAQTGTWQWHRPSPVVDLLLNSGAELDIFSASILGHRDGIEGPLTQEPGLVNAKGPEGVTPLCLAAWNGRKQAAELLLEKGADVNASDDKGRTPMCVRYEWSDYHEDIADLLLQHGAALDVDLALALDRIEEVKAFVEADPGLIQSIGLEKRSREMADMLLAHGAEADIFEAAEHGLRDSAEALIQETPELLNARREGTPLHRAAQHGRLELVMFLAEGGAEVNAKDGIQARPLHNAARGGHTDVAAYLLAHGADIQARNNYGCSPLFYAVMGRAEDTVELLLKHDANPNDGLARAAETGVRAIGEMLIAHGAEISVGALRTAVLSGQTDFVDLLIAHGANPNQRDWNDKTMQQLARERDLRGMVELLRRYPRRQHTS